MRLTFCGSIIVLEHENEQKFDMEVFSYGK